MEKLVIIGVGDTADDVTKFVERYCLYDIVGYACDIKYIDEAREKYPERVIYELDSLQEKIDINDTKLFVAISPFHMLNKVRKEIFQRLKLEGYRFATLISPLATVLSDYVGEGCWIQDNAYISTSTCIGENVVIDILVYIAHYTTIDDHTFVAGRATVMGGCKVGKQCFIGAESVLFNNISVGNKCLIGGATIIKHTLEDCTVCKLPSNIVIERKYDEEVIETKLMPGDRKK